MSRITIVPPDGVVVLGDSSALGVGMSSVDPTIHAIQFNTDIEKGWIEFKPNVVTGELPPQEEINSVDPWHEQITEAEEIIFCYNNPKTFYSTVAPVGRPLVVTAKGWPQPENSTDKVPPVQPSDNTTLYWSGSDFVWSVFPIDLNLPEAKSYTKNLVNAEAYSILQPTDWYVVRQSETGVAIPEDWNTWRASVRTEANTKRDRIAEQESLSDLEEYCTSPEFKTWPPQP